MDIIEIEITGLGHVRTGVAKTLLENESLIEDRLGFSLDLTAIADIDIEKDRGIDHPQGAAHHGCVRPSSTTRTSTSSWSSSAASSRADLHPPGAQGRQARGHGQQGPAGLQGPGAFDTAQSCGKDLYYEASVGGGVPIIKALRESLVANNFEFIYGILNGTCNFILTEMSEKGSSFETP